MASKSTIQLRLYTASEMIERVLHEKINVKIGRQEKGEAEKDEADALTPVSPISPISPIRPAVEGDQCARVDSTQPEQEITIGIPGINNRLDKSDRPVFFKSKVVSRSHAEIWLKDGEVSFIYEVFLRDVGSSSGTFLNKLRLSPANKMSRPYPLRQGDVIQLGVDYQGRTEDLYKSIEVRVSIDVNDTQAALKKQIPIKFKQALTMLMRASNPYSTQKDEAKEDVSVDCCICISSIGPFQALFIAPCSHCFHYKCIQLVLSETIMFPCPVCRQIANLEASVSMESVCEEGWKRNKSLFQRSKSSLIFDGVKDRRERLDELSEVEDLRLNETAIEEGGAGLGQSMDLDSPLE